MVLKNLKKHALYVSGAAWSAQQVVRKHTTTALSAAFAFILALTWRDTIRKIVDSVVIRLAIPETAYFHEVIVAIIVTIICIAGIMISSRLSIKEKK